MTAESSHNQFQSRFSELGKVLACPACRGDLRIDGDRVVCESCGRGYPIVDGIPVLIMEQASRD
jgi:uncharacterized protein YbaR (Trm112 family)